MHKQLVGFWLMAGCAQLPAAQAPAAEQPPPPATLTYLGVAGWSLQTGAHTLLFDPYVSRGPIADWEKIVEPDAAAIERFVPARAELIMVSHSHVDHVLDVPAIALRTGAAVFGTSSTAELARASGVPERQIASAHGGEELVFPAFRARAVRALHSLTGQENLPISAQPQLPMAARAYHEGGTLQYWVRFAGHALYFVGTANFIAAELKDMPSDVAIVAVGMREKIPDYTCTLLRALGLPKLVLANHFDAWQEPLEPGQMTLSDETRDDLDAFAAEVHACAPNSRVVTPVWFEPIAL